MSSYPELFPASFYELAPEFISLQEAEAQNLLPGYMDNVDEPMLKDAIREALWTLTPQEAMVIRLRFGLDGVGERTRNCIGDIGSVGRERVRQVEKKALRKLSRSHKLKTFYEEETTPWLRSSILATC